MTKNIEKMTKKVSSIVKKVPLLPPTFTTVIDAWNNFRKIYPTESSEEILKRIKESNIGLFEKANQENKKYKKELVEYNCKK